MADYYRAPGWMIRNVVNKQTALMVRLGISVRGARVIAVRGRTSGQWRATPVSMLRHDGRRYVVSPRGETQWVRNLRAAGTGELRLGRRAEPFRGRDLAGDEHVAVLRAYMRKWRMETGIFFEGVGARATDEQIGAIAGRHPVFEIVPVSTGRD
jgi:deazaflavin-dependent oxidoreductase (nitroreductase family)